MESLKYSAEERTHKNQIDNDFLICTFSLPLHSSMDQYTLASPTSKQYITQKGVACLFTADLQGGVLDFPM